MKNKLIVKVISLMLSMTFLVSLMFNFGCGSTVELPDYSNSNKSFNIFCYNGPTDGENIIDGNIVRYGSFRTVERYKEYKDAGFDTLFLTGTATYDANQVWGDMEKSETYKCMVNAWEAGIKKIIIDDARLEVLITKSTRLVGNKTAGSDILFSDTDSNNDGVSDELFDYVYDCMKPYVYQKGFYGMRLGDEPKYTYIISYGQVYQAVRAAAKKYYEEGKDNPENHGVVDNEGYVYMHINLAPIDFPGQSSYYCDQPEGGWTSSNYATSYEKYMQSFLDFGMDRLSVDIYAFRGGKICSGFYANLQKFKEVTMKNNAHMTYVLQVFNQYNGSRLDYDNVGKSEMVMELYSAIGLGADNLSYYTYMPSTTFSTSGIKTLDDSCFLSRQGEKHNTYYYVQDIIARLRKVEKILLSYDYKGSKLYFAEIEKFNNASYKSSNTDNYTKTALTIDKSYEFELLKNFTFDNDVALVTESYDKENDLYMYLLQNVIDPRNGADGNTDMTVQADFGAGYKYVAEINNGDVSIVELNNGVYEKKLSAGYAVHVIPLK